MNPFVKRAVPQSGRPPEFTRQFNARLERIHADVVELEQLHRRLSSLGFSEAELAAAVDCKGYCLLGEHLRPETLATVAASEGELLAKAVISQPLVRLSTPALRLLAVITPDLHRVRALRERIEFGMASALSENRGDFALHLPPATIRALEAQPVQITGYALGCEWLLIVPDPVFGVRESLLESRGANEFEIELPCASGLVTVAGLNEQGHVLRKQVRLQAMPPWSVMPGMMGGLA